MTSTLFALFGTAAPVPVKPAGALGTWASMAAAGSGANAKALSTSSGTLQTNTIGALTSPAASAFTGFVQYCSQPLAAGSIASGSWAVGFARNTGSGATQQIAVYIALVNGITGAVRTVITNTGSATPVVVGGASTTSGSERTGWSATIAGAAATITAGDYLVVEVGMDVTVGSPSGNWFIFDSGTTAITGDGNPTSSAQSFVTCPTTLAFQGTTLYANYSLDALAPTLPAGALGTWTNAIPASAVGANARGLTLAQHATQTALAGAQASPVSGNNGFAQYASPPLAAGSIASGTWTVAFARQAGSAVSEHLCVYIALVNGATGAARTVISNAGSATPIAFGTASTTSGSELAQFSAAVAGAAATITDGDYLVVEIGIAVASTTTGNWSVFDGGTTPIVTDNAVVASTAACVICPSLLAFTALSLAVTDTDTGAATADTCTLVAQTRLYFRPDLKASAAGTPEPNPSTHRTGGYAATVTTTSGANAGLFTAAPGSVATTAVESPAVQGQNVLMTQTISPMLAIAQTINGTLTIALSIKSSLSSLIGVLLTVAVVDQVGNEKALLCNVTAVSHTYSAGNQTTIFSASVAITPFAASAGHYLVFEVGVINNTANSPTVTIYEGGTGEITADFVVSTNDASSFAIVPAIALCDHTGITTADTGAATADTCTLVPQGMITTADTAPAKIDLSVLIPEGMITDSDSMVDTPDTASLVAVGPTAAAFDATITGVGAMARTAIHPIAATITGVGGGAAGVATAFVALCTGAGTLGRAAAHPVVATITGVGAVVRAAAHPIGAALTGVGTVGATVAHRITATITGVGAITRTTAIGTMLSATITAGGAVVIAAAHPIAAALSAVGAVGAAAARALSATITAAATLARGVASALAATITATGAITRAAAHPLAAAIDAAAALAAFTGGATGAAFDAALTLAGTTRAAVHTARASAVPLAGTLGRGAAHRITATITGGAALGRAAARAFASAVPLAAVLFAPRFYAAAFAGAIAVAPAFARTGRRVVGAVITPAGVVAPFVRVVFRATLTPSALITRAMARTIRAAVTIATAFAGGKTRYVALDVALACTGAVGVRVHTTHAAVLRITPTLTRGLTHALRAVLGLVGALKNYDYARLLTIGGVHARDRVHPRDTSRDIPSLRTPGGASVEPQTRGSDRPTSRAPGGDRVTPHASGDDAIDALD